MVKIHLDVADLATMRKYADRVDGFTTNPSLMKKAGVTDYRRFAIEAIATAEGKPISLEVLSDDWAEMERQAETLARMSPNVWVKIPISNTRGEMSTVLVWKLRDLNLNVTAVLTDQQIGIMGDLLRPNHILSVFMGRIADTGVHPVVTRMPYWECQLLWASARQVYSVYEADSQGFDIITLSPDLVEKLPLHGKPLDDYSLETVQQFFNDGKGLTL